MALDLIFIALGLTLLYYGGELLVTGSIRISQTLKIPPFVIGATVVGFGTSAPELAVSIMAGLEGAPEVAVANVIGSNVANVGLVLGLTALLLPLTIQEQRFKREMLPLIFSSFLILFLAWDHQLVRLEGVLMMLCLAIYLWQALRQKDESEIEIEEEIELFANRGMVVQGFLIVAGLVLLILGARFLVDGGVSIAKSMGISEWFIGITIVAIGTSLPEIVSSLMAAKRGHGELAIGNVFGSNIFNMLMVLGMTSILNPLQIREAIHPDLIYTTAFTCLLLILIRLEHNLSTRDGVLLLVGYCSYVGLKGSGII
jgi:cation:H+ antiporter